MSVPKHTPGPWAVASCGKHGHDIMSRRQLCVCVRDPDGHAIAEVCSNIGDEFIANERLITAAPDLLLACTELLYMVSNADSEIIDRARAAIAKARGEA